MTRLELAGGWYVDSAFGAHAVLYPDSHIGTSRGRVGLPGEQNVLFLVCAFVNGTLYLAGKGHSDGQAWLWDGSTWTALAPATYGNSPVAMGPHGLYASLPLPANNIVAFDLVTKARTVTITKPLGVRGIASVTGAGLIASDIHGVDDWYGQHGLAEFLDLGGLFIGQGAAGGCVAAGYGELEPGDVQFIRAHRDGDNLALAMWKPVEKQAVVIWTTVTELQALRPVPVPVPVPTPVPAPVPTPMPTRSDRFWLGPNIASPDLLTLFEDISVLKDVGVFTLYVQHILTPNLYNALVSVEAFKKLKQAGILLNVEMGSVKPGDCKAESNTRGLAEMIAKVRAAGGEVFCVSMDEPLTAVKDACFKQSVVVTADAVAAFMRVATALNVEVCWIEAWPHIDLAAQRGFLSLLTARGTLPHYWHLDIDWQRAQREGKSVQSFIQEAQSLAALNRITLGVFLAGYSHATDAEYFADVQGLAHTLAGISPNLAHVLVQSWAVRSGTAAVQDLPRTLGASGLLASLKQTQTLFAAIPPPVPSPVPQGSPMLSTFTDPSKGVIAVKAIKPVPGTSLFTLILPNDRVFSCQPDGSAGDRDPGADGGYEKCRIAGNAATFKPEKFFTWTFVEVGGL